MTLRNHSRSPSKHQESWRQDIISCRHARLQRSLERLRTHPAVNPTGPHGPHGNFNPSSSLVSSRRPPSTSPFLKSNNFLAEPTRPTEEPLPGIIPALFNDLVRRELGIDPKTHPPTARARLDQYLSSARAVTYAQSLSDPSFVAELSTGNDPSRLRDRKLISAVVSKPAMATGHSQRVHEIHLAIQRAQLQGRDFPRNANLESASVSKSNLRRSTRKRAKTQKDVLVWSNQQRRETEARSNQPATELAAFRPSPESVRKTRSEAARARGSALTKTPSECCFCPDPSKFEGEELDSELVGPFVDRRGNAKLFVHFDCACWAPQVFTDPANGQLRRVYDEYCRGRKLKCSSCGEKGATIGCYIQRCKKVFHYRCLVPANAYCVERFFAAFCVTHSHLGKKPSYKILMEAATIADVSAAQRREDTTFGLDAPHSRYTMLRRRETEIIFSRKWGVSSHNGAFDDGKVVFSHRRKLVLGKHDRIGVADRVRVLKTSVLDVASGRLAFMALAQKNEGSDDVTAVQARAAIASRECTGLLLLRNLRNARQWRTDDIEVVRSIPMESNNPPRSKVKHSDVHDKGQIVSEDCKNRQKPQSVQVLRGQKRASMEESGNRLSSHERKKQRVSYDTGNDIPLEAGESEIASTTLRSAKLPSFERSKREQSEVGAHEENPSSDLNSEQPRDTNVGCIIRSNEPSSWQTRKPQSPELSNSQTGAPSEDRPNVSPESSGKADATLGRLGIHHAAIGRESRGPGETRHQVRSAWKTFLDEELPKERVLRPDDSMADSLRNMARLWSLMTPAQREAYEKRGQGSGTGKSHQILNEDCTELPRTKYQAKQDAGLFSGPPGKSSTPYSSLTKQIHTQEGEKARRQSASLSTGKDVRRGDNENWPRREQPNWDALFPSALETNASRPGESNQPQLRGGEENVDRVRAPPPRLKGA